MSDLQHQPTRMIVETHGGQSYLLQRSPHGGPPTYLPLPFPQVPQPASQDQISTVLILTCSGIALLLLGLAIGFFLGKSGRDVQVIPRSQVCTTTESSNLFGTSTTQRCQ